MRAGRLSLLMSTPRCGWLHLRIVSTAVFLATGTGSAATHVWEVQEIALHAARPYAHPYTDVECWVELKGPGFSKRIYGFWDGGDNWRVRVVATAPGNWTWTSGSDKPDDRGLTGKTGSFTAQNWTEVEKQQNANRRGFLRATANAHALQYADGTPFFLVGDTWLAAGTWRLPVTGKKAAADYEPGPGVSFEEAVAYRKKQGFNSVSFIAAFPTWASDQYGATYADKKGIFYRNAWEKFGVLVPGGGTTAKDMSDERGYRPFEILPNREGLPDFDAIVPQYFQSLDKKMQHLSDEGFVAMLETTRRDNCPPWKEYFNFNQSYTGFVQYLIGRYGAYNFIFSKIHLDIAPKRTSLTPAEFNEALNYHLKKYGPMPFGQPVTSLIDHSTYTTFGHEEKAPWITMHSVGNRPRNNAMYEAIETLFRLAKPYPAVDLEPYYTGWDHDINNPDGVRPPVNSDRDNYFSRAMMYGCVLSGALVGHVHGTGAYDITTGSEPQGWRPYFHDALKFTSGGQMQWLKRFFLSEGARYQELNLASEDIAPRQAPGSKEQGLDGWSFMMRAKEKDLAFLYFEQKAQRATLAHWTPAASYQFTWYDPRTGDWLQGASVSSDQSGAIRVPPFPNSGDVAEMDWAAKIVRAPAR
jgi:hypothetical protein